ncbi:MAG: spondin domain-containing protein [Lacipirellulaceae bacterium]
MKIAIRSTCLLAGVLGALDAHGVEVRVTVQNLAPTNSVSFAPLRLGFNNGTFDTFNEGAAAFLLGNPDIATAPIVTVAEGGSGSTWFPAFAAADPTAVLGTVVPNPAGPLLPGATGTAVFNVNHTQNPFFTFGSMVVPSTDYFIGNDSPTQYRLFNADGTLAITSIEQRARDIWNAGSETENPANGAFLVNGVNDQRENENGVVEFDFDLATDFNGQLTRAGYVFDSQLVASTPIYRITFEAIPEPSTAVLAGLSALVAVARRSR